MYGVILQGLKKKSLVIVTFKSHGVTEGYRHRFLRVDSTCYHTTGISFISITSAQNAVH